MIVSKVGLPAACKEQKHVKMVRVVIGNCM